MKPVKEMREVEITFPLPSMTNAYMCRPGAYASHLIGHESQGSILALLKKKGNRRYFFFSMITFINNPFAVTGYFSLYLFHLGWAQDLSAGLYPGAKDFDFFTITVTLTEEGSS